MRDDIPQMNRTWTLQGFPDKWFVGRDLRRGHGLKTTGQPMSAMLVLLISALMTIALVGCGSEKGEIPFTETGTVKTEIMIDGGKNIEFWTRLDVNEEGTDTLA